MEIVRRVLLLAGVLGAVWCALWPEPALVQVTAQDFAKDHARRPRFADMEPQSLEAFIVERTKDRLVRVEGAEWEALVRATRTLAAEGRVETSLVPRVGGSYSRDSLYYRPDEAPVNALAGELNDDHPFTYAALASDGRTEYLAVTFQRPKDAGRCAPAWLLHPLRRYALWALVVGLACYVLLPWPRRTAEMVYYSRMRATILPDGMGTVLVAFFFALPLLIIPSTSPTPDLFDAAGGWGVLTIILWVFAAFWLSIHAVAASYGAFRLELLPEGLRRVTLWGEAWFPYAGMESVGLGTRGGSGKLAAIGFLASLLNWRAAGPTLLAASRTEGVMEIACQDGRRLRLGLSTLHGAERLLAALQNAGVAVDPKLEKLLKDEDD
jgi:hypothetical protein